MTSAPGRVRRGSTKDRPESICHSSCRHSSPSRRKIAFAAGRKNIHQPARSRARDAGVERTVVLVDVGPEDGTAAVHVQRVVEERGRVPERDVVLTETEPVSSTVQKRTKQELTESR